MFSRTKSNMHLSICLTCRQRCRSFAVCANAITTTGNTEALHTSHFRQRCQSPRSKPDTVANALSAIRARPRMTPDEMAAEARRLREAGA